MVETKLPRARHRRPTWLFVLAVPALVGFVLLVMMWRRQQQQSREPEASSQELPPSVPPTRSLAVMNPESSRPEGDPSSNAEGSAQHSREGIGAFPPPGTKRIKVGIVVPQDFPLPTGYMRHYQTTDKGEMLRPILMFHPDYKPVDAQGNPFPIPESRIVPPEMAPPGMPIERLEVPADAYADPEKERAAHERR